MFLYFLRNRRIELFLWYMEKSESATRSEKGLVEIPHRHPSKVVFSTKLWIFIWSSSKDISDVIAKLSFYNVLQLGYSKNFIVISSNCHFYRKLQNALAMMKDKILSQNHKRESLGFKDENFSKAFCETAECFLER